MTIEAGREERKLLEDGSASARLAAFVADSAVLVESGTLAEALTRLVEATAKATGADAVVARIADGRGGLTARAVWASSTALAAELEGSRLGGVEADEGDGGGASRLHEGVSRLARRAGLGAAVHAPVVLEGAVAASIEAMRRTGGFGEQDEAFVRLASHQLALALRVFGADRGNGVALDRETAIELVAEALGASAEHERTADRIARVAAEATGALGCLIWSRDGEDGLQRLARYGAPRSEADLAGIRSAARTSLAHSQPVGVERVRLELGERVVVGLRLGEPALGVLQLVFRDDSAPGDEELARLAAFAVRASHTLRSSERRGRLALELERTRALLAVVGQAIAQLSLAHTLETAVARVADLLGVERVAVYLREHDRLEPAAGRGMVGPHVVVAESLLDLALAPSRSRGLLVIDDAARDGRLAAAGGAVAEAGIEAVLAVPLLARDEVVGLLAAYPPRERKMSASEVGLVTALASQLAVAVQNARLHEHAKRLGAELEQALTSERQAARHLGALYEISRAFAQSLSLEMTVEAVARTVVETLSVDAAVIAMLDARRESFVPRAVHVADRQQEEALRAILSQPQALADVPVELRPTAEPVMLEARGGSAAARAHELLAPFLELGATAAVLPVATPAEVLATLTLLSLDPARPLTRETVEIALSIARQAALAIDNARLYQQQKAFADTMQRSLVPRTRPTVDGIEVGDVYESPTGVDVGGDVYDFLALDGRVAVVVGDVTGHGIAATSEMALAKFAFRSLVREHPEPSDFLASVNEVVLSETSPAHFITMTYVVVDPERDQITCATAGHPPPRLVRAGGEVVVLAASGLALGIEQDQTYGEVAERFEPGSRAVLYTDGVVEARRGDELYGFDRLDAFLAENGHLAPQALASALVEDCRAFAGGELTDDCAVVVVGRTA